MPRTCSLPLSRRRWLGLAAVVLMACCSRGVSAAPVRLGCDVPLQAAVFALPVELRLDTAGRDALLLVEERGADVLIQRSAEDVQHWDSPPSAWAYQLASLSAAEGATARWSLQAASAGLVSATLRLRLLCTDPQAPQEFAVLRTLAEAGREFARAEDAALPAPTRIAARVRAASLLGEVLQSGELAALLQRWPWLRAQALQTRAYALARMGRTAEGRGDLHAAAAAWQAAGDTWRSTIARHREAQQMRREGILDDARKMLQRLQSEATVQADASLLGVVTNDLCLTWRDLLRLDEALACFGRAVAIHERAGNSAEAALSRANRAAAYASLGRYAEAEAEAQAASVQAQHSKRPRAQLMAALVVGNVARAQGRLDVALQAYLEGLALAEQLQDPNLRANAQQQIGIAYLLLRDFERARVILGEAAAAYEAGGYWKSATIALRNLADAQRQAGAVGEARSSIVRAQAIVDAGRAGSAAAAEVQLLRAELALQDGGGTDLDEAIAAAQSALGDAPSYLQRQRLALLLARRSLARGALPAAGDWLRRATAAATRAGDALGLVETSQLRALLLEKRGEPAAAKAAYLQSLQQSLRIAALQSYPLHRSSYLGQARRSLEQALRLSLREDAGSAKAAALRIGWLAALQETTLSAERATLAGGDHQRSGVLAAVNEQVRRRWGIKGSDEPDAVPAVPLNILLARAEQSYPRAGGGLARSGSGSDLVRAWQQRLQPGEVLLATFVGEDLALSWSVRRDGIEERVAEAAAVRDAGAALLAVLRDTAATPQQIDARGRALAASANFPDFQKYTAPLYFLSADGVLATLPPAFLFAADAASRAAQAATPLPAVVSIGSLQPGSEAPPLPACCKDRTLQVFADPSLRSWSESASTNSAAGLPRLPGSRSEARAIAARWPQEKTQLWLGADFTRSRTLQALNSAGAIVHFATHGFASRDEPGLNALLVVADDRAGGLDVVSFHDLLGLDVQARLVVLGACEAAAGGARDEAAATSLAHAVILAGADEVVAPLWRIDDATSASFMTALYDAFEQGLPPAAAVAEAQARLARRAATAHPFQWAGFAVQRGGGR